MRWRPAPVLALLLAACRVVPPPPCPDPAVEPSVWLSKVERMTFSSGGGEVRDTDPEVTPDGRQLLFASNVHGADFDLYRQDVGGKTVTRVAASPADERFPRAHPDWPEMLAFCSNVEGEWHVYTVADSTGEVGHEKWTRVSPRGRNSLFPTWSPGERKILFSSQRRDGSSGWELVLVDLGSRQTHYLGIEGIGARWGPDGRVVFQRMRERDGWTSGLWTFRLDGHEVRDLTVLFEDPQRGAVAPSWDPTGTSVAFSLTPRVAPAGSEPDPYTIYTIRADGTELRAVLQDMEGCDQPVWGAPGWLYFVSRRGGRPNVWRLPL